MQRPTGVTIISVLAFIGAACLLFAGLGMFLGGAILSSMAGRPGMGLVAGIGGAVVGVIFLGLAVLDLVLGIGLWKLQNWARILAIVLLIVGAICYAVGLVGSLLHFHLFQLFFQMIFIAIDVWIAVYLSKASVKQAFVGAGS
ncbi:MAG TPA: hypothetical protein VEJ38_01610 [Candidatus Acidoferrales bacterium]|nr:hypothetical protein [Candidatus Acidoferrales bacterium]